MSYKLRVDTSSTEIVQEMCDRYFESYIYAQEDKHTDNPHFHLYAVLQPCVKEQAVRVHCRRTFGQGNGHYSLKQLDGDKPIEYLAYILKQGDYVTHNIDPFLLADALAYDEQVKTGLKEKKANKRTQLQKILEDVFADVMYDETKDLYYVDDVGLTELFIVERVVKYFKDTGTLIRKFAIVSICQTLCLKYCPFYSTSFAQSILSDLQPRR